jgi:predicted Zn-dependent protease
VDGEGVATRELVLVEEGKLRQPLLAWWEPRSSEMRPSGCNRRDSWRDLPRPGPSHLFFRPQTSVRVTSLLGRVARGYYLIGASGRGRFDLEVDRFCLPVCGFAVEAGRPKGAVARAWLGGSVGGLLRGIQAVARDLCFFPLDGMIGSPTLLVTGLEVRDSPW